LVTELYKITAKFPKEDQYGLASQIRRASVSIPANIAEGEVRNHRKEYTRFIYISIGSASELETLLLISSNLKYLTEDIYRKLSMKLDIIMKMLTNLQRALLKNNQSPVTSH
jgi:four helix bundle protein